MKGYADLICHRREILPGRYETSYTWDGDPNGTIELDRFMLERCGAWTNGAKGFPERLNFFGIPLRLVKHSLYTGNGIYARVDTTAHGLNWLYLRGRAAVHPFFARLKSRLIYTAMVWGLAWVEPHAIPSWHDIGKKRP